MKLLSFIRGESDAKPRVGAWLDGDIVDLEAAGALANRAHDGFPHSLRSLIAAGPSGFAAARRSLDAATHAKAGDGIRLRRDEVRLLPPIPDSRLFFCVGKNNKSHLEARCIRPDRKGCGERRRACSNARTQDEKMRRAAG